MAKSVTKAQLDEIIKAARGVRTSQFELGDAIKKACPSGKSGANNGSTEKLIQVKETLAENGFDYDIEMLRKLRTVSEKFLTDQMDETGNVVKAGNRFPGVSWTVHLMYCPFPDKLQEWVEGHPGEILTVSEAKKRVKILTAEQDAKDEEKLAQQEEKARKKAAKNTEAQPDPEPVTTTPVEGSVAEPSAVADQPKTPETIVAGAPEPAPIPEPIIVPAPEPTPEDQDEVLRLALHDATRIMLEQCRKIDERIKSGINKPVWESFVEEALKSVKDAVENSIALIEANVDDVNPPATNVIRLEAGGSTATH